LDREARNRSTILPNIDLRIMKENSMKTSEDVRESGLYTTDCCGEELTFGEGDTFWRCPRCQHLCRWELEFKIARGPEFTGAVA
jgi:hypothetical protein